MIEIVYHRDLQRVTVKGHAKSAERGHDLVCAAASMLTSTLAKNVQQMEQAEMGKIQCLSLDDGNAEIWIKPKRRYKYAVGLVFDALCVGFMELAQNEKNFVKFEVRG